MQLPDTVSETKNNNPAIGRRSFLGLLGVTAGVLLLPSCKKDDEDAAPPAIDMGSGDEGLLRYAYSLETFMVQISGQAAAGRAQINEEKTNFETIQQMHQTYREFFRALLNQNEPANLEFDTTKIAFGDKNRVHESLITITELLSSAYMDMAGRFADQEKRLVAAKIASACARHATRLRWTRSNNYPDRAGTDAGSVSREIFRAKSPQEVVNGLDVFLVNKFDVSKIS